MRFFGQMLRAECYTICLDLSFNNLKKGPIAQLVERCIRIAEIRGSIPLRSTHKKQYLPTLRQIFPQDKYQVQWLEQIF